MFEWVIHRRAIAALIDRGPLRAAPFAHDIAVLPGDTLAVVSGDRVEFINTRATREAPRRASIPGSFARCAVTCDGALLLVACDRGHVDAYSTRRARLARRFDLDLDRVDALVSCPAQPALFFTAGSSGPARINDLRTGRAKVELAFERKEDSEITAAAWSLDGRMLAVTTPSDALLFDAHDGSQLQRFRVEKPQFAAFCPSGESLYIADSLGRISAARPWSSDVEPGPEQPSNDEAPPSKTVAMFASRDGAHVLRVQRDGGVTWFSTVSLRATRTSREPSRVRSATLSLDRMSLWLLEDLGVARRVSFQGDESARGAGGPVENLEFREGSLIVRRFDGSRISVGRDDAQWIASEPVIEREPDTPAALRALESCGRVECSAAGGRRARVEHGRSVALSSDDFASSRRLCVCSLPVQHLALSPDGAWLAIADCAGAVAIVDCAIAQRFTASNSRA